MGHTGNEILVSEKRPWKIGFQMFNHVYLWIPDCCRDSAEMLKFKFDFVPRETLSDLINTIIAPSVQHIA